MKTLIRLTLGCTIAALVFAFLPACDQEQAPVPKVAAKPSAPVKPELPADTGLVPDQASTGNPPMIPHEVEESDGGEECLGCHKDGVRSALDVIKMVRTPPRFLTGTLP
jgi:nitrate reductase cytochrome c-type subunit